MTIIICKHLQVYVSLHTLKSLQACLVVHFCLLVNELLTSQRCNIDESLTYLFDTIPHVLGWEDILIVKLIGLQILISCSCFTLTCF